MHLGAIEAKRPFLRSDAPVLVTASGLLFAALAEEGALAEAGVPPPALRRQARAGTLARLFALRRSAALVAFENLVYPSRGVDPRRLYAEVDEQMLELTRRTEPVWPAHASLLLVPFTGGTEILAAMIAAGLREALEREIEGWKDPRAGAWLRERVMAPGASVRWEDKIESAAGIQIDMEALSRELGIRYEGPELGESDEVSDRAVEEYFKDLES